jgi:hypothetical protein
MPNNLRASLSALATTFADQVLAAIRSASLDELVGESTRYRPGNNKTTRDASSGGGPSPSPSPGPRPASRGRLVRRSSEQIEADLAKVVTLVKTSSGLRSEDIQKRTGLDKRALPRVLKLGLEKKVLRSRGVKRSTTYSAA